MNRLVLVLALLCAVPAWAQGEPEMEDDNDIGQIWISGRAASAPAFQWLAGGTTSVHSDVAVTSATLTNVTLAAGDHLIVWVGNAVALTSSAAPTGVTWNGNAMTLGGEVAFGVGSDGLDLTYWKYTGTAATGSVVVTNSALSTINECLVMAEIIRPSGAADKATSGGQEDQTVASTNAQWTDTPTFPGPSLSMLAIFLNQQDDPNAGSWVAAYNNGQTKFGPAGGGGTGVAVTLTSGYKLATAATQTVGKSGLINGSPWCSLSLQFYVP